MLSVCNVTAYASLFFSKQQLIIPAKPLFIGSIPIAASNKFANFKEAKTKAISLFRLNAFVFHLL
jgi:hypothetical protein